MQNDKVPNRRKRRLMVFAGLGAAVLAAGGGATATAMSGAAPRNDLPVVVASSGGPTLGPSATPTAPAVTAPNAGPSIEPPLGPIPKIANRSRVPMPLDSVMTSMSDITLIETAGRLKARTCMRALGFKDWQATTILDRADNKESDLLDYLNPASVARSGYPSTLVAKSHEKYPGKSSPASKPSRDAVRAFFGTEARTSAGSAVPHGGCRSQGDRQVKAGPTDLPVDPRFLAGQAKFAALRDSRMRRSFATWRICMNRHGQHYDDPISAQNDPRWGRRTAVTQPSSDEKQTAVVDATCQRKINLVGTYKALEIAYQNRMLTQNKSQLLAAKKIFAKWAENARSIIADS